MGVGLIYWVPTNCLWEWFQAKKGTLHGVVVIGMSVGATGYAQFSRYIANPDNVDPHDQKVDGDSFFPDSVAANVPRMLRYQALLTAILSLVSICLISRSPEAIKQEQW